MQTLDTFWASKKHLKSLTIKVDNDIVYKPNSQSIVTLQQSGRFKV